MQLIPFIKAFTKNPRSVSTIFPSMTALAKDMAKAGDISNKVNIVEIGVGTGALTKELINHFTDRHNYTGFEIDESLFKYLNTIFKEKYSNKARLANNFSIKNESAETLTQQFEKESVDLVVSSLPWSVLHEDMQTKLLDEIAAVIKPGGTFTFYNYVFTSHSKKIKSFKSKINSRFSSLEPRPVILKNIPPANVWVAKK